MPVNFYRYRFILTGGGTGGHIMPLLAVAEVLKDYPADVLYIGERGGREELLAKGNGLEFRGIYASKWRRYWDLISFVENILGLFKIVIGCIEALAIVVKFRPKAILVKGGYVSLPVMVAGWLLKIPMLVHESDAVPGVTNRIGFRLAKKVATGFPVELYSEAKDKPLIYTGIPLQRDFFNPSGEGGYEFFKLDKRLPVLLITGGIQGSHIINETIKGILPQLLKEWQVIHLAGEGDYPMLVQVKESINENQERYLPFPMLGQERVLAMQMASVVISRASMTTLAELSLLGKAVILVPLASAAGNHQVRNAQIFKQAGAVEVIEEDQLTGENLYETIESLRNDNGKKKEMERAITALAKPEAGKILTEELINLARG